MLTVYGLHNLTLLYFMGELRPKECYIIDSQLASYIILYVCKIKSVAPHAAGHLCEINHS